MRIYISGCFESRSRLAARRGEVEARGHGVASSWLDEPDQKGPVVLSDPEKCLEYAQRDYSEVLASELLIVDTEDTNTRGGREVEVGIALAFGRKLWVVGPRRNIFHYLAHRHFPAWEEALEQLGV